LIERRGEERRGEEKPLNADFPILSPTSTEIFPLLVATKTLPVWGE
jgi:hypothetical protein